MPNCEIKIRFKHRNFAALEAEEVPFHEKLDGAKLWPYPNDTIIEHRFENFTAPSCSREYSGTISIKPIEFELESFQRNIDRELDMQKTPHGYVRLPTAILEATIVLEDLPAKIHRTLLWYSKLTQHIDYNTISLEESKKLSKFINAIISGEKEFIEFVRKNRRNPNLIHVLARTDDEDFEGDFNDRLSKYEKSLEPQEIQFLKEFSGIFESIFQQTDKKQVQKYLVDVQKRLNEASSAQAKVLELQDKNSRRLRWRYWREIYDKISKEYTRKPTKIDPVSVEVFGQDVFHILRHYWNLVIRYLRYEKLQYWIEELPTYEIGQFFIRNISNIIPYASIQVDMMLISEEVEYMNQDKWNEVLKSTRDMQLLEKYAGGFEVGGIFSQSMRALVDREFENAVILALIGLDYAMSEVLPLIRSKFKGTTPGKRIPVVRKEFKVHGFLDFTKDEYDNLWNEIMNEKNKTGLLFLRNNVVHEDLKLSSSDSNLRAEILQMIKTARLLAYRMLAWKKQQP